MRINFASSAARIALGGGVFLVCACGMTSTGGGGTRGASSELVGTWDVLGTQTYTMPYFGTQQVEKQAITVQISTTGLSVTSHSLTTAGQESSMIAIGSNGSFNVAYVGPLRVEFAFPGYGVYEAEGWASRQTTATRVGPSSTDLGAMPFDLSGLWTVSNPSTGYGCTSNLGSQSWMASCTGAEQPIWLPNIQNSSIIGTRTAAPSAMFGMLGGSWNIQTQEGGTCMVNVGDSTVMASCIGTSQEMSNGTFDITFGDGIASGHTSRGIEFSAQRR